MASGNQIRLRVAGNRLKAARQRAFVGRSGAAGGTGQPTPATLQNIHIPFYRRKRVNTVCR